MGRKPATCGECGGTRLDSKCVGRDGLEIGKHRNQGPLVLTSDVDGPKCLEALLRKNRVNQDLGQLKPGPRSIETRT